MYVRSLFFLSLDMIEKLLGYRKKIFIGLFLFNIASIVILGLLARELAYVLLGGVPLLLIQIFVAIWGFDNENERLNLLILLIAVILILPLSAILLQIISSLFS